MQETDNREKKVISYGDDGNPNMWVSDIKGKDTNAPSTHGES